jgi:RNA polymerase sigma-70 factor (ECF subfamily)
MERSLLRETAPVTEGPYPEGLEDFDELMRQHQPRIFRFLLASLRDRDAAENLTQRLARCGAVQSPANNFEAVPA